MSRPLRLSALALVPASLASSAPAASRRTPTRAPLTIRVTGARYAATPLRVVASGGRLTAGA